MMAINLAMPIRSNDIPVLFSVLVEMCKIS